MRISDWSSDVCSSDLLDSLQDGSTMSTFLASALTRRGFIASSAAVAAGTMLSVSRSWPAQAAPVTEVRLRAAPDRIRLVPETPGDTSAWCYTRTVPGPEIRVLPGAHQRIQLGTRLARVPALP